jgi:hypothetical protein
MTQYKLVVDCTTGKQEYIALTPAEIAERDQQAAAAAEEQAKREAQEQATAAAKQSAQEKLKNLGLSDTEVTAITGV